MSACSKIANGGGTVPIAIGSVWDKGYRYGFNGQEKDDDIKGEGNSYAFEYRVHDSRLGRFLNLDPLSKKFPYWTPYQFAGNQCISSKDIEGLESSDDLNELHVLDNGKFRSDPSPSATNQSPSNTPKSGSISYSNDAMRARVEDATREFNYERRGWVGRKLHKNDIKKSKNKDYQPSIANIVNNAINEGFSIYFTNQLSDIPDGGNGQTPQGALIKKEEKVYTVFAGGFDVKITGTDPLWEEVFHLDNAIKGIATYTKNENGIWGIWDRTSLLLEEARAKYQVVNNIRNILPSVFEHAYSETNKKTGLKTDYGYFQPTSFGTMIGKTEAEIFIFISTGLGTLNPVPLFEYWFSENNMNMNLIKGIKHKTIYTQQRAYQNR